ncbi:hypothetical protein BBO_03509 [Beauveria brongniartii RCEF 3172]|uniref:Uncharacterized protein n=1 Tax=Beauveria brongniartii RCEF 3172 TaxID=1081107 RepID=A0A162JL47_9HYPO|nr:hypothetical protein BBO_03509 [Beauveria brongniartii RCEF 3172]
MISSRLQRRLLSVRCAHSPARSAAAVAASHTKQRRLASSSPSPPRQPRRQAAAAPRSAGSGTTAAATLSRRMQAEKDAAAASSSSSSSRRPAETADDYKTRYKSAARRWTLTMIALPILLVTSYYLFDRLALGHERKVLNREATKRDD